MQLFGQPHIRGFFCLWDWLDLIKEIVMCKYLLSILFIGLAWGKENTDRLILKNGQKTEYVSFGEKVTIFYNYSDKNKISGAILEVTEEKIKFRQSKNGQIIEIKLSSISRIDRSFNNACYSFALIGAISAGGYVASVGNWDGGSESFVGMIITPIAAMCGAGIGGIIGVLSDNLNNSYLIKKGEWEIIVQ